MSCSRHCQSITLSSTITLNSPSEVTDTAPSGTFSPSPKLLSPLGLASPLAVSCFTMLLGVSSQEVRGLPVMGLSLGTSLPKGSGPSSSYRAFQSSSVSGQLFLLLLPSLSELFTLWSDSEPLREEDRWAEGIIGESVLSPGLEPSL